MSHLTYEEIYRFVSFTTLSEENLQLAAKINAHILKCDMCLSLVREMQDRYDNMMREDEQDALSRCGMPEEAELEML